MHMKSCMILRRRSRAESPVCASMRKKERADGYGQPVVVNAELIFCGHARANECREATADAIAATAA